MYFCSAKIIWIMAKPIEPTPVLKGDDAYEFVAEMEKQEKASAEEKERVAKGASFIQSGMSVLARNGVRLHACFRSHAL